MLPCRQNFNYGQKSCAALQNCLSFPYSVRFLNLKNTHQNTMKLIIILFRIAHSHPGRLPSSQVKGAVVNIICVRVCERVRDWGLCCFALAAPGLG